MQNLRQKVLKEVLKMNLKIQPNEGVINWCRVSPVHLPQYIFKLPMLIFKIPAVSFFQPKIELYVILADPCHFEFSIRARVPSLFDAKSVHPIVDGPFLLLDGSDECYSVLYRVLWRNHVRGRPGRREGEHRAAELRGGPAHGLPWPLLPKRRRHAMLLFH